MIIEQIKLKNYRQYRDNVTIDFGYKAEKNINIIVGSTGAGKTNLSNAIQWCLYGKEPSLKTEDAETFGILNMSTFEDMKENDVKEVSVEVTLNIEDNRYSLIRVLHIIKSNSKQEVLHADGSKENDGSSFKFYCPGTKNPNFSSPHSLVASIIPERISEYFFFDGEKLENYFNKKDSGTKIKEAIFQISQLDILQRISERIGNVISEMRKEGGENNSDAERVRKEIENIDEEILKISGEKKEKKLQMISLRNQLEEYQNRYAQKGGDRIRILITENNKLEKELENLRNKFEDKERDKVSKLLENYYFFKGYNILNKTLKIFKKAEDEKIIPPNIDPEYLGNLIKKGKCICGNDISKKNSKSFNAVNELLVNVSKFGKNPYEFLQIENEIKYIIKRFKHTKEMIDQNNVLLIQYKEKIAQLENVIKQNNKEISNTNLDEMENYSMKIDSIKNEMEKIIHREGAMDQQEKDYKSRKEVKENELKDFLDREGRGRIIRKKIEFYQNIKNCAEVIMLKIMDEIRIKICQETKNHYQQLHWKKGEKIDLRIDEDYEMSLLKDGFNILFNLSSGEKALLIMSFV